MKTVALVPSYEPNDKLVEVVRGLAERDFDVVVVNDGSGPDYDAIFAEASLWATVIGYINNQGKGSALKVGFDYILKGYPADTIVVTVDGDGQHTPDDVARCAEAAAASPNTLILGARSFDSAGVPLKSRLGNIITRAVFAATSGVRVSDTQTGLRAFSLSLARRFTDVAGERFEYEMNVLYACAEWRVPMSEVSIDTIYFYNNKHSHFHPLFDSARIYRSVLAFAGASFVSFLCDYLMFALLTALLAALGQVGIVAANIIARLASATLNYTLNRTVVFRSTESVRETAPRYALLAASILAANTVAVSFLTGVVHVPPLIAKLLVECVLFAVSWAVQHRAVFVGKERVYA